MSVAGQGSSWQRAVEVLQASGLVVFPTDTVYGVGCDPYDEAALARIYEAKGRDASKAIPLLLSGPEVLPVVSRDLPTIARALAARYWPGPLTLVVPRRDNLPELLSRGPTVAVRVPDHDELRAMIRAFGGAVAATSANRSGEPDACDAEAARAYLGGAVDLIIDGGATRGSVPSSVVNCTGGELRILREGALPATEIDAFVRAYMRAQGVSN